MLAPARTLSRSLCKARDLVTTLPTLQWSVRQGYKGAGMEGWVARWYARTRPNEMQDFRQRARAVAEHLSNDSSVLEIAPGPGYFAIELAKQGNFPWTASHVISLGRFRRTQRRLPRLLFAGTAFTVFLIEGRDNRARIGADKESFAPAGNDYPVECQTVSEDFGDCAIRSDRVNGSTADSMADLARNAARVLRPG